MSSALVTVLVTDANDNVPVFDNKNYEFTVKEDAGAGEAIGELSLASSYYIGNPISV